ncbi:ClpP-like prohead protease/major capsid protein fusion protein [Pseudomonas sp. PDM07]|uniref:ClpP-like prohead protease/major capsid protein fusion protein n=1 Tax=Pseudomonas sp. PDM07 TaxID=2769264 RepID=UPI00298CCD25|nr:ClpP-like prohead protease/major capsid protein fusion protein [Pseudomonas sp. PDM07]
MMPRASVAASVTAAISAANQPVESWYSMRAMARGSVEILLYDEIGAWGITAKQFAQDLAACGDVSQINLRIHSPGGDVFAGMAIYNTLKAHPARVDVYIDGLAASMASVIAMAGDKVYMPTNAMMMIHKPWGAQGGDAEAMRQYADLLDKVEGTLVQAYASKTGKSPEEIHALLKAETWMDGSEAVAAGFADQLIDPLVAAAQLNSKRMQEFEHMPAAAYSNLMNPRNQVPPAPAPVPAPAPAPSNAPTTEQIRAQIIAEENDRRTGITAAFGGFAAGHSELLAACIGDMGCTIESARAKLLAKLGEETTPSNLPGQHGHISNGNLVGDSVRASLEARIGIAEIEASNGLNHMRLNELARASLTERGILVATLNPMQMVGLAFTHGSSDFGQILLDIAGKSVLAGWEEAPETFQLWTKKGQLSDFKTSSRVGLGEFPSLREVRPGAEYKHITLSDRGEPITLATYGELFSITRQAIINDDLSLLSDVPYKMGQAARATIGDLVYAVLTSPPKMRDGKSLFDASRKNNAAGPASELSIASLIAGKTAMASQKTQVDGGKARTLNIRPAYVLTPVALEDRANQLINSASVPGADVNSGIINPIRGFAKVIGEPRLDDASPTAWYMAAKQGSDTIEVAYLNGIDTPYVEQQNGFTVDGVASKVRIDAGVAPSDFRGLYSAAGK